MNIPLTPNDSGLLASKGIPETQIEEQLEYFATGFPSPEIVASASIERGITVVARDEQLDCIKAWDEYLLKNHKIVKFVPASGAASRMFKNLYEFIGAQYDKPSTPAEKDFFGNIRKFAFFDALNKACAATGMTVSECIKEGRHKDVASTLLESRGLGYGQLPKGLLLFHSYHGCKRTAVEEHLAEGAMYAKNSAGDVNIHFTVSPEHEPLFVSCLEQKQEIYEDKFSVKYNITFSHQKPSTDTIAAGMDNLPFRDRDGNLVFRPGGHGALIENLNDMEADIVFIKNIDNVTPDSLKYATVVYKKTLAGLLITLQNKIFNYLRIIDSGKYSHRQVEEMIHFLHNSLCIRKSDIKHLEDAELILYLKKKLHRPLRVCGMVRNESEPGGGPFLVAGVDGTVAPQILESSQINLDNPEQKSIFEQGTHFNPVDLVCALRDHRGNKYNLPAHVDPNAGFISLKSKDGRPLKALELPGLWNGAMSDWNTVFVEVPIETFTPVKTVNDLLRREHQ
ncbi:MAG: DUF4301 family protein [Tannerellaceae bacterium]|jgi:hypothetical protein|nr:DUF4301 family protein [Tannerellaceae bacterium]